MVRQVKTNVELKEILQTEELVVVDFSATWCGPCRAIAPLYETLSKEFTNITFLKVDVDEFEESDEYEVTGLPSFLFFRNNVEVDRVVGAAQKELRARVESFVS